MAIEERRSGKSAASTTQAIRRAARPGKSLDSRVRGCQFQDVPSISWRPPRAWLRPLFVLGHASKGVIYLLVGGLALLAAFSRRGKVAGEEGAVKTLGEQPFGRYLLIAAGVGLVCYAVWRVLNSILNLENKRGLEGAGQRVGGLLSALVHGSLAVTAFQLGTGRRAHGHEGKSHIWVERVLDRPFGDAIVAIAGLGLIGFALHQLYSAVVGKLAEPLAPPPRHGRWMRNAGRLGLAARGVVFSVIGARLLKAGLDERSHHARDFGSALRELASQPGGTAWLSAVAAGLAAYGVYQLVVARYGRVPGA